MNPFPFIRTHTIMKITGKGLNDDSGSFVRVSEKRGA